jgi:hypothetical protein
MVFTLFERFRKGFCDVLASYRGGFGADVPLSSRLKNQIPYICPYLGFSFGSASPILVLMAAISLIAYHLASHSLETKLRVDRVARIRSGRRFCSVFRPAAEGKRLCQAYGRRRPQRRASYGQRSA